MDIDLVQPDPYLGHQNVALHVDVKSSENEKKLRIGFSRWNWQADCDTFYITLNEEQAKRVLRYLETMYPRGRR